MNILCLGTVPVGTANTEDELTMEVSTRDQYVNRESMRVFTGLATQYVEGAVRR